MLHFTLGAIWLTLIVKFLSFHIDLVKTHSVVLSAEHTTLSDDFIISFIIIRGWNIKKSRNPLGGMWMMSNCLFFGYLHMQKHRYSNIITYYLWTHASTQDRKLAWSHAQTLSYAHEQTTIQRSASVSYVERQTFDFGVTHLFAQPIKWQWGASLAGSNSNEPLLKCHASNIPCQKKPSTTEELPLLFILSL